MTRLRPHLARARTGIALMVTVMAVLSLSGASAPRAQEAGDYPFDGMVVLETQAGFDTLWERLAEAVDAENMLIVARASASRFAATRGIAIAGNGIVDVFRNDFAVRLLAESAAAGFEAPMRFYLTERADGGASLAYRRPSALLAPYGDPDIDLIAAELDAIFEAIAARAVAE
ncbi:MAG: DUF302 domain-containing protein [Azospirillaceae bacterium]